MNKWFASARDLSDSESEDSSEDEKKPVLTPAQTAAAAKKTAVPARRNYMKNFEESSESEEENRVVKTKEDKQQEVLNTMIKDINNHLRINDFSQLMTDFDKFCEEMEKDEEQQRGIIFQKGKECILPLNLLRLLVKIENAITETQQQVKDKKLNLNKTNSVQMNKLKQKMKKYLPVKGPAPNTLEQQIAKFRENPVWSEDERKAAKAAQKTQEEAKAATKKEDTTKIPAKKTTKDSDESESEEEEEEESEYDEEEEEEEASESSSEEEGTTGGMTLKEFFKSIPREQMTPAQRRLKWVKKDRLPQHLQDKFGIKKTVEKVPENKKEPKITASQKDKDKEVGDKQVDKLQNALATNTKEAKETILNLKTDYNQIDFSKGDNVVKKIKELQDERMRGKFDPKYHLSVLTFMLQQVKDAKQKVDITLNLLNSLFDSAKISSQGYMGREIWLITFDHLTNLIKLLDNEQLRQSLRNFLARETKVAVAEKVEDSESEEADADEKQIELAGSAEIEKSIMPSIANFMEKLDYELLKAYQNTPHNKIEYLQRLRDENKFLHLCDQVQSFLIELGDRNKASRVAILKLDHLHFKNDSIYDKISANQSSNEENKPYTLNGNSQQAIDELVQLINQNGTNRMKIRAALYTIYHHSIHNRFHQAKDLLLKTHIGDIINGQDIGTQIIYNRAITQIGMSAFRNGLIEESHDILVDICQTAKLREVLAQGISRSPDKPIEFEKEELKRQVPFHMHINLHQLDCIYMITAMLLEIPNIAENQYSVNKKVISKNFKKLIDQYDAKAFYLAAENYRDNLVFAAKQLNKSNWKAAIDHIFCIKLIQKMPEFTSSTSSFKDTLVYKFKEAALKAFLCRGARNYHSFGLESLSNQFDIPVPKLRQVICKMVVRNKIQAHFDNEHKLLILDTSSNEVKELQQLSSQYVDKLEVMVENNERLIDMIGGGGLYNYKERTAFEISAINATKRQKQIMKMTGSGMPNVSQQTQSIISNPTQRQQR